ncbi:50S ribosomal protein L2 [Cyclobacterium sp. 1_MG-2023]|uniref:Large ribosomal subunit protein uL2 n=1 Tax=Cyclobacterium marinum (strain ATCC 25205 / DSM 745 / LMG 13164 / NCIMB 1802) TaxID=880070 RepID=G0IXA6_CYCMS|nr:MULTISPECIES: 50S ribosomal protein L2 [Cyclobacterium]AEL26331.1 ribosomal protein L2 [Cyclobacterium marinum DSM 745]MDO6438352.1 50S ribosomal protein L2 [Cyclobacterium sp. 1_MG-2023]|tara:strand:+ start:157618 stop:158442 length:825 start_codon:yes stop_codon:yes gene_type:complete
MAVKKLKPVTPGTRFRVAPSFDEITTSKPEKSLLAPLKKSGGRNHSGKMTSRYLGGGHKKRLRIVDFKRNKEGIPAVVKTIEYDPNRTARIALLFYKDGSKAYMIAPEGLEVGQTVITGEGASPEVGNTLYLKDIPLGTIIHNIELKPGKGGAMARSAGGYAQLLAREGKYVTLKLPSGEMRVVLGSCKATIGTVSNGDHMNVVLGKAGRKRWLGRRPRTRGVAMNPVDHPMGGGEGRSSGGHPRSRTGLLSKGKKTRSPKKYSNKFIISRRTK